MKCIQTDTGKITVKNYNSYFIVLSLNIASMKDQRNKEDPHCLDERTEVFVMVIGLFVTYSIVPTWIAAVLSGL